MENRGKLSGNALKRSVLKSVNAYNKNNNARIGSDAGETKDGLMVCSAALSGNDPYIAGIAVIRAINSLAVAGGKVDSVTVSLFIPALKEEHAEEQLARKCLEYVKEALLGTGAAIISGNTVITDNNDLCVSVSAAGHRIFNLTSRASKEASIIVMTGDAGTAGAHLLLHKYYERITKRLTPSFAGKASVNIKELDVADKACTLINAAGQVAALHDVADGGVFGAIWELCEREKCGCEIFVRNIPIKQVTVEICEILDISPYQLTGDGAFIAILPDTPENAALGTVIGHVTADNDRVIINGEERRFLEPNRTDTLYNLR